jgi:hypothetical protein
MHKYGSLVILFISLALLSLVWTACEDEAVPTGTSGPVSIEWHTRPPNLEATSLTYYPIRATITGLSPADIDSVKAIIEDEAGTQIAQCRLYDDANFYENGDALDFCSPFSGDIVANNGVFSRLMNGQFALETGNYTFTLNVWWANRSVSSDDSTIVVAESSAPVLSEPFFPTILQSGFPPVQIHVKAVDDDAVIDDSVTQVIMKMYSGGAELDSFELADLGNDVYGMNLEANFAVGYPTDDYGFTFRAFDTFNLISDPLEITVTMENLAPWLPDSTIVLSDTLYLPAPSELTIDTVSVKCWDDQTVEDIAEVHIQAWKPNQTWGSIVELFDDGDIGESGDPVAGDSVYTRIISLSSSDQTGYYEFHFRGLDQAGNEQELIEGLWVLP